SSIPSASPWSSVNAAFWTHASATTAGAIRFTSALWILLVNLAHQLSGPASGSSAAIGQLPGVVNTSSSMAPPSIGSSVGRNVDCGLGLVWFLLLQVPPNRLPGSSIRLIHPGSSCFLLGSPPPIISTLDSVCRPPPG
ncbi:hypothetical protein M9458_022263, partial [Cirrhinus mrigala]